MLPKYQKGKRCWKSLFLVVVRLLLICYCLLFKRYRKCHRASGERAWHSWAFSSLFFFDVCATCQALPVDNQMKEVLLTLFYYSALVDIGDGFLLHNIQIVRHAALVSSWDFSACKVSASDILQGHGAALARIFFQDFGVRWLLIQILVPPKVKKYSAISCLKCLLALGKAA